MASGAGIHPQHNLVANFTVQLACTFALDHLHIALLLSSRWLVCLGTDVASIDRHSLILSKVGGERKAKGLLHSLAPEVPQHLVSSCSIDSNGCPA